MLDSSLFQLLVLECYREFDSVIELFNFVWNRACDFCIHHANVCLFQKFAENFASSLPYSFLGMQGNLKRVPS